VPEQRLRGGAGQPAFVELELGYGDPVLHVDWRFRLDRRRLPGRLEHHALDRGQARVHIGKLSRHRRDTGRQRVRAQCRRDRPASRFEQGGGHSTIVAYADRLRLDGSRLPFELRAVQVGVDATRSQQLLVRAALDDAAVVDNENLVGLTNR